MHVEEGFLCLESQAGVKTINGTNLTLSGEMIDNLSAMREIEAYY